MRNVTRTAPTASKDQITLRIRSIPATVPCEYRPKVGNGLAAAYEHCRLINRTYGKTYYLSTGFFPARLRPSVHALYAWVRYPDEWVDNPGPLALEERLMRLKEWREATCRALSEPASVIDHPVLAAWGDSARAHGVPMEYMHAFLDAMEMDLTVDRYATFADLQVYTYGSASVVGLMMCRLTGVLSPEANPYATKLGLAMQLTNFLRDVGEDWRERGRIYLPMEDLERFNVSPETIDRGRVTEPFRELMRFEVKRTREIYAEADAGFHYLPEAAQLPVRLARVLYARILDKIEQNDYDVLTRRARVPTWEKLAVLARERGRRPAYLLPRREL